MLETLDILITFSALMFAFSLVTSGIIGQFNELTKQRTRIFRRSLALLAKQAAYACERNKDKHHQPSIKEALNAIPPRKNWLKVALYSGMAKFSETYQHKHSMLTKQATPFVQVQTRERKEFEQYLLHQFLKINEHSSSQYLSSERFLSITKKAADLDERYYEENTLEEIHLEFEQTSSDHFRKRSNWINLLSSIVITFALQINAFDLLNKLSLEEDFKNGLLPIAESLAADPLTTFADINYRVNNRFIQAHQQAYPKVEQLSSGLDNHTLEHAMDEFDVIFKEPEPQLRKEYQAALTDEYQAHQDQVTNLLAEFNFALLPHGLAYFNNIKHYPGLLLSIVLISFGAPFWYKVLHGLLSARNIFNLGHKLTAQNKSDQRELTEKNKQSKIQDGLTPKERRNNLSIHSRKKPKYKL